MNIFSSILQKIGIGKPAVDPQDAVDAAAAKAAAELQVGAAMANAAEEAKARVAAQTPTRPAPARPAAIPVVDVVAKLEGLASSQPGLNWKVSIVDLLKLLDIDSSFESRKELATELGCPADLMNDSARMNTWLHKIVLQKIAENGGNIPTSLLN